MVAHAYNPSTLGGQDRWITRHYDAGSNITTILITIVVLITTTVIISMSQNAMNLPPDKARLLRQYDNEKKWELICDQ
ncbi:Formin-like protein 2, partial [Plecturocebus cupreus]